MVQSDENAVVLEGLDQVFRFFVVLVSVVGVVEVVLFCVFWLFVLDGRVQVSFWIIRLSACSLGWRCSIVNHPVDLDLGLCYL